MVASGLALFTLVCAAAVATVVLCSPSQRSDPPPAVQQKSVSVPTPRKLGNKARDVGARRAGVKTPTSSTPRSVHERPMTLDPRQTWQAFLRHSERTETRRPKKKVKSSLLRMQGPQGPPGPRGPRGPPGANITREEMFREFKELLRQAVEMRVQLLTQGQCKPSENCSLPALTINSSSEDLLQHMPWAPQLFEINHANVLPRTHVSFFWELSQDVRIKRGKDIKLQPFHRPFAEGSLERGDGLNSSAGVFTAPMTGLYTFFASVFLRRVQPGRVVRKELDQPQDQVSAVICIDSLCYKHLALRTTSTLSEGQSVMTLTVNGPLMLKTGRQVSLWVWNRSRFPVTIEQGSQFSGYLAGL